MKSKDPDNPQKGGKVTGMETSVPETNLIPMAEQYYEHGFNVLLVGLHGTGKTQSLMDMARKKNIKLKYYSCSTLDPFTDLVGVPYPRYTCVEHGDFETRKEHHDFHPDCSSPLTKSLEMVRPHDLDEAELIFFDEFNRADSKTMNAVFEIIQFRSINGEPLPNLRVCWAAMNPPDDNYQVDQLDPALLDRFDVYVEVLAKPSVSYMSRFMHEPVAKALKMWYDEHERKIRGGAIDARVDYISPRRLLKIGLVWEATKNTRSVHNTLPMGGTFDRNKLLEYLKAAQRQVDNEARGIMTEEEVEVGQNIGDRPAPQFIYQPANMRIKSDELTKFLEENPLAHETHNKVASALKQGVGGDELVLRFANILNALSPSILEGLFNTFPSTKQSQARGAFAKLYKDSPNQAKKLSTLHGVLKRGSKTTTDFPQAL